MVLWICLTSYWPHLYNYLCYVSTPVSQPELVLSCVQYKAKQKMRTSIPKEIIIAEFALILNQAENLNTELFVVKKKKKEYLSQWSVCEKNAASWYIKISKRGYLFWFFWWKIKYVGFNFALLLHPNFSCRMNTSII